MPVRQTTSGSTKVEFRRFSSQFRKIREAKAKSRTRAVGTLTPGILRAHLKSGQDVVLDYGTGGKKIRYTLKDLKKFADEANKTAKKFDPATAGVPALKLIGSSAKIDIARANNRVADGSGIKNATLYSVKGNEVHFRVTASEKSTYSHHLVRIRLEEWNAAVVGPEAAIPAIRRITKGRLSFDCDCGRHQYWYRYLATIGGFALKPFEFAFPKIRNPRLDGACCKHVIKCISALQSPTVHALLAKHYDQQSNDIAFAGDPKRVSKYLSKEEAARADRARKKVLSDEDAMREYEQFKKAESAFAKKATTPAGKKALESLRERSQEKMRDLSMKKKLAEEVARKEIAARRKLETDQRSHWVGMLKTLKATGMPLDTMIESLSKNTGAEKDMLTSIAKEEGLL